MIAVEARKQLGRLRTRLGLSAMILVPALMAVAFKVGGSPEARPGETVDFFALATHSGLNFALVALLAMSNFFLVVVVTLFAGESVAGEATWGSLRYLLIRPVGRSRLLLAKLTVAYVLSLLATFLVLGAGLGIGTALFGWHPVTTPLGDFAAGAALGRLVLGAAYVGWSMTGVILLAFALSTMTDAVIGPVGGAVCIAVVSEILDQISALGGIRPLLFTHYWQAWTGLFARPAQTGDMLRGVLLQVPWAAAAAGLAWWSFRRKDVVS